ncbi:putative uracil dna glycosylase superfamily protein [Phaeomoniella chlamydospora]|uniref:Putative uracil dna glycosylase superfamily protein n=1 Tax=Phaeomoniella chlamydospora TaxID=158046 RepID=A0A0G2G4V5_PHACM|nr:putative uracil dna glycosylase superfamily protein [Phaeomoniella chlamydospora]
MAKEQKENGKGFVMTQESLQEIKDVNDGSALKDENERSGDEDDNEPPHGEGGGEEEEEDDLGRNGRRLDDFRSRLRTYSYSPTTATALGRRTRSSSSRDTKDLPESSQDMSVHSHSLNTQSPSPSTSHPRPLKRRLPTQQTSSASRSQRRSHLRSLDSRNPPNLLTDSLRPNLQLVLIGLNPGLQTAATGHAYAHPSNLFWKLLHSSGLTAYRHPPSDTHALMDLYSIGNTNLCSRPTRDGSSLSKTEMEEGVSILVSKIRHFKPEVVGIVGKGIWDVIERVIRRGGDLDLDFHTNTNNKNTSPPPPPPPLLPPLPSSPSSSSSSSSTKKKPPSRTEFHYGLQNPVYWLGRTTDPNTGEVTYAGARTFVVTTTSGLAAGMKLNEKEAIWKELGDWILEGRRR